MSRFKAFHNWFEPPAPPTRRLYWHPSMVPCGCHESLVGRARGWLGASINIEQGLGHPQSEYRAAKIGDQRRHEGIRQVEVIAAAALHINAGPPYFVSITIGYRHAQIAAAALPASLVPIGFSAHF